MLILRALYMSIARIYSVCMMNRVLEFKPHSIRSCKHEMRIIVHKTYLSLACVNSLKLNQLQTNFVFVMRTSLAIPYIMSSVEIA